MSATQLAALVVAFVVAGALCALAARMVYAANRDRRDAHGATALALGIMAVLVVTVGALLARPAGPLDNAPLCDPGTYRTQAHDGAAQCATYPAGRP